MKFDPDSLGTGGGTPPPSQESPGSGSSARQEEPPRESPKPPPRPEPEPEPFPLTSAEPFRKGTLPHKLEELYTGIGMAVFAMGDPQCANVIITSAHPIAAAWDNLARENRKVKEVLERILTGGAWASVISAHLMIALPIAQHHGLYPADWPQAFGVPSTAPKDNGQPASGPPN